MRNDKNYAVTCKCSHAVEKGRVLVTFPVKTTSKKRAAEIARWIPRATPYHKDYILDISEMSDKEYSSFISACNGNTYLSNTMSLDRKIDTIDGKNRENKIFRLNARKKPGQKSTSYDGKTVIRNPKKYLRFQFLDNYEFAA